MQLTRHNPASMAKPLGLYSHVTRVAAHELLFIAGQLSEGIDLAAQAEGIFRNIGEALRDSGANWSNVVQLTTYLTREDLVEKFMSWRQMSFPRMFPDGRYPPNTLLIISGLVEKQYLMEVQTVAAL